jgi:peptidoglycan/LPS O-acetylase OafA/YrhL
MSEDRALAAPHPYMTRIQSLDGLRAISILMVLAYHARLPLSAGGFMGVDVFFVLSGFVISVSIAREIQQSGRFRLGRFLLRRLVRLLPALLLMTTVISAALAVLQPERLSSLAFDALAALTYSTNIVRAMQLHEPNLHFGHTWSLGVEQQFYLVWPLLVWACFGRPRRLGSLAAVTCCLILLVVVWRAWLMHTGAPVARVYFGTDTRLDGVLAGCVAGLAVCLVHAQRTAVDLSRLVAVKLVFFSAVAALFILFLSARQQSASHYNVPLLISNLASVVVILGVYLLPNCWLSRSLAHPALVHLGFISYGVYLWHYPIFRLLLEYGVKSSITLLLGGGVLALILAQGSYTWVEAPLLRWFKGRSARGMHAAAIQAQRTGEWRPESGAQ